MQAASSSTARWPRPVRPSTPGDIIEVTFGNRPIKVRVLSDVEPRTKDVAREMYEVIAE